MQIILSVSIAVLAGLLMTRVVKSLKLPDVTAYLTAGIFVGPYFLGSLGIAGLGFISMEAVDLMTLVSQVALGFIAFAIGNEFRLEDITHIGRQAVVVGVFQGLAAMLCVDTALLLLHILIPDKLSVAQAITLGAISTATAPAATLMVVRQYKASGPLTDLLLPVVVLIATCIVGLIYTGGYYEDGNEYFHDFMGAFSNASSGAGLAIGSMLALVFTFIYFWLRGSIGFEKSFESVPNGFIQMISPILILTFAWTLCGLTRYGMNSADFVVNAMSGAGDLAKFLPAVIFIIGAAIGFATGTSWGTIGIMAPIVVQVFDFDTQPILCTIGLAAACSGGVMGDHCSPISDTTIMASAGAHCYHLNHVFTQIPYALTVAGVAFVSFILAGIIQNVVICLIIACVLMVATLLVIRAIMAKKHQGIFQEMAEADKALAK